MSALAKYVEERNFTARIFKKPILDAKALTPEDITQLSDQVENDLSPENLTCDGELSARAVNARYKFLNKVQLELAQAAVWSLSRLS